MSAEFFSGAGGGLISGGIDAGMTGVSYGLNAKAASKAHDRSKNMMTRGPTYNMIGLKAAGLNPILAATGGALGGGAMAKTPQAAPASTYTGGAKNLLQAAQRKLLTSQTQAAQALTMKTGHEAALAKANATLQDLRIPEAMWQRDFANSDAGRKNFLRKRIQDATPDQWQSIILKEVMGMIERFSNRPPKGKTWVDEVKDYNYFPDRPTQTRQD